MPIKPLKSKRKKHTDFPEYILEFFKSGKIQIFPPGHEYSWSACSFFHPRLFKNPQKEAWLDLMATGANPDDYPHGRKLFKGGNKREGR